MKKFLYLPCSSEKINVINMKKLFFAGLLTAIVGGSVVAKSASWRSGVCEQFALPHGGIENMGEFAM